MSIQPNDQRIKEFTDYILNNYINSEEIFLPNIWADFKSSTMRTTNACESFHAHFNSKFHSAKPNLYHFIEVLKTVQIDDYIKIRRGQNKWKLILLKENFIEEKMMEKILGKINRFEFVKALSFKFLPTI